MKIKSYIYTLIACYLGVLLRLYIKNNFIISILEYFFVGFIVSKRLSYSGKNFTKWFFSCFTSFSGFIYFLYGIFSKGDWIQFIIFNVIIIVNIFMMYFGFWISRKIT